MKTLFKIIFLIGILFTFHSCDNDDDSPNTPDPISVTDINGNVYETVTVGTQVWTTSNFKATQLNDGTPIEFFEFTPGDDNWFFNSRTTSMYALPFTADLGNNYPDPLPADFYGYTYSRGTINSGKLAPAGWRVPTLADFQLLESHLTTTYGAENVSKSLRSQTDWFPNDLTTNESGFTVLPNGYTVITGSATGAPAISTFSTSDDLSATQHTLVQLVSSSDEMLFSVEDNRFCGAIRLIKE